MVIATMANLLYNFSPFYFFVLVSLQYFFFLGNVSLTCYILADVFLDLLLGE
jgi:hypothetical protein